MNKNEQNFIDRVNQKYGVGTYTFESMVYVNAHTKIELYCTAGKHYFIIAPMHMVSSSSKGCNKCQKNTPYSTEEFIEKCKSKHGDKYTYDNTVYVNQKTKVKVFCTEHSGEIEVNPATLLNKDCKCGICHGKYGVTRDVFIERANEKHSFLYNYDKTNYVHSNTKVIITCLKHGDFEQTPKSHLYGRGCPDCGEYGYQPSKPGYFYVQKLESEYKVLYKYGITGDMDRRITEQSRNSVFNHTILVERYFEDGKKPLLLEKFLKTHIESGIATPDELQSGFTETFDEKYLSLVLEIVNNFK